MMALEPHCMRRSNLPCSRILDTSNIRNETTTNEMATTYLETRYVDRAKLDGLLQSLFGQSYSVMASATFKGDAKISFANTPQVSGDTISVEASRELTEVRSSIPGRLLTRKGLLLNRLSQVEKDSVSRNK